MSSSAKGSVTFTLDGSNKSVSLPVLSRAAADPGWLLKAMRGGVRQTMLLNVPLMLGRLGHEGLVELAGEVAHLGLVSLPFAGVDAVLQG